MSIDNILREQGGVISRDQATAAGLTPNAVDDRLRRRRWRPLFPQVYLVTDRPADAEVRVRAAVLWAGGDGVLTGAAAAWWWGLLPQPPTTIVVAVPRPPPRARPGIVLRRRELAPPDLAEHRGLRLAARPLAVLETAVELGAAGASLLDRALRSWLPFPIVFAAYRRTPSAAARRVLDAAAERSTTAAGRLLGRVLPDTGTGGWCRAEPGAGSSVVVTFPTARVAVEVTGWASDRSSRAVLIERGWTVLSFTWADLVARPHGARAEIAAALGGS